MSNLEWFIAGVLIGSVATIWTLLAYIHITVTRDTKRRMKQTLNEHAAIRRCNLVRPADWRRN